jgi:DNA helicase IV
MQQLIEQIAKGAHLSAALRELDVRLTQSIFVRSSWFDDWAVAATKEAEIGLIARIKLFLFDKGRSQALGIVRQILDSKEIIRVSLNEQIVSSVLQKNEDYFATVEKNPLTQKQREACASDEDATLVIAGAGTGKTSTIVAKIGLLLRTKQCSEDEILAISFTSKSAKELAEKIRTTLKVDLQVSTFHKLGLDTLAKLDGGKSRLAPFAGYPEEKAKVIDSILGELKDDSHFLIRLLNFYAYHRIEPKQSWDFKTLAEYSNWIRNNRIVSLDGLPKKSFQECVIANWLILNGVRFEYEKEYEHPTNTVERRQYCPDFYLLDSKIYIEHFGVDKAGNPAPYINAEQYKQGMAWKRAVHAKHKTNLIETFSWQHNDDVLLFELKEKLQSYGVDFAPIEPSEALARLNNAGMISDFSKLVCTFLTLYKGNGNKLADRCNLASLRTKQREQQFLSIFEPILQKYEEHNKTRNQIDFEDMIVQAARFAKANGFVTPYRYIFIDEFQDISPGRAELVKAIRDQAPDCALFAVGDDWQSIYRFAGTDIGSMTHFNELFGANRQVTLDTTFRFDDQSVAVSSEFVLKNKSQIPKALNAVRNSEVPSLVLYMRALSEAPLDWSLDEIHNQSSEGASVFILERYNFNLPQENEWARLRKKFPKLNLEKMSIHAAKGLEADYVVMGLRGGQWGFPSQVVDDSLFNMVLSQADSHPNAEERRLFYVALSRARYRTYLVCETGQDISEFASELIAGKEYPKEVFGIDTLKMACQKCVSGTMLLRDGSNGKFYGCSNYPLCSNTEQTCPKCGDGFLIHEGQKYVCHLCGHQQRTCPRCKTGLILARIGVRGPFNGCSNYWDPYTNCRFTENG